MIDLKKDDPLVRLVIRRLVRLAIIRALSGFNGGIDRARPPFPGCPGNYRG